MAAVSLENVVEYIAVLLALWQHDCIVVPMEECSAHALSQVQAKAGLDYLLCGEMRPGGAVLSESVYLIPQGGQAPNSTPAPIDAAVFCILQAQRACRNVWCFLMKQCIEISPILLNR